MNPCEKKELKAIAQIVKRKDNRLHTVFIIVSISFQLFILCTDPTRSSAFPVLSERNLYIFPVYHLKSEKCGSRGGKLFTVSRM